MVEKSSNLSAHKARAIILISGQSAASAVELVDSILSTYNLEIMDQQKIQMANRLIAAFEIGFDPAHLGAIEKELAQALSPLGIDLAIDIL